MFLTAGGGDSVAPVVLSLVAQGSEVPVSASSVSSLLGSSLSLSTLPPPHLCPLRSSLKEKNKNENNCQHLSPTRAIECETGAQMSSLTALSTLIKRNHC